MDAVALHQIDPAVRRKLASRVSYLRGELRRAEDRVRFFGGNGAARFALRTVDAVREDIERGIATVAAEHVAGAFELARDYSRETARADRIRAKLARAEQDLRDGRAPAPRARRAPRLRALPAPPEGTVLAFALDEHRKALAAARSWAKRAEARDRLVGELRAAHPEAHVLHAGHEERARSERAASAEHVARACSARATILRELRQLGPANDTRRAHAARL